MSESEYSFGLLHVFTALHTMRTRSSDENSVRLSVFLSNAWFVTKRKKVLSRFYTIRKIV